MPIPIARHTIVLHQIVPEREDDISGKENTECPKGDLTEEIRSIRI